MKKFLVLFVFILLIVFVVFYLNKVNSYYSEYYSHSFVYTLDECLNEGGNIYEEQNCPKKTNKIGPISDLWCRCICCKPEENFFEKILLYLRRNKTKDENLDLDNEKKKEKKEEKSLDEKNNENKVNLDEKVEKFFYVNIDNDFKKYQNEKYNFSFFYPENWYLKDYSEKFNRFVIGVFPSEKKEGWEYNGDIQISVYSKDNFDIGILEEFNKKVLEDKNVVFIKYDLPGNIDKDVAYIDCADNFIVFSSLIKENRDIFDYMIGKFSCLN